MAAPRPSPASASSTTPRGRRPRFQLSAAQRYERELIALDDAARLAQLWEHALNASYELGRATGYQAGRLAGRDEEAAAWQAIVTGYSEVISQPRHVELLRLRQLSNDPCATGCGQCSQCIHAGAVQANLARYGQPDFPGVAAARAHTARSRAGPSTDTPLDNTLPNDTEVAS